MSLFKPIEIQIGMDFHGSQLGTWENFRQPKHSPTIIGHKLTTPMMQASEHTSYYAEDSGKARLAFFVN